MSEIEETTAMSNDAKRLIYIIVGVAIVAAGVFFLYSKADATNTKVYVCHKPGTPAEQTLHIPTQAVYGHLGHGDYKGHCKETTTTTTEATTTTTTEATTTTVPETTTTVPDETTTTVTPEDQPKTSLIPPLTLEIPEDSPPVTPQETPKTAAPEAEIAFTG